MAYRRSIFLINKPFQFRFSLYVCSWLVALSFIYPLIVQSLFDFVFKYMARDPAGPPVEALLNTRREVLTLLIALEVVFLLFSFLISIFMSHRIAGPLYKLSMFLKKAKGGDYSEDLYFRKADHFLELATEYNEMNQATKKRLALNSKAIAAALQVPGISGETLRLLNEAKQANEQLKI
jgi:methyl-accepting chemotaxis protein